MGGSASTRRVVVEDVDGSGVVKISESVVKRIRGQPETAAIGGVARVARDTECKPDPAPIQAPIPPLSPPSPPCSPSPPCLTEQAPTEPPKVPCVITTPAKVPPVKAALPSKTPPKEFANNEIKSSKVQQLSQAAMDSDACYMQKLKELESRNAELQRITNEQFIKAVQEVEQKFLKHTCSPVCQDLQSKVYECYISNPRTTLNCSAQVRAFSTCVERARQNALIRKG